MFGKKKRARKRAEQAKNGEANAAAKKETAEKKDAEKATATDLAIAAAVPKSPAGKVGALVTTALDPKAAKKLIAVGKIAAPVLAPYAYKFAATTREYIDNQRARRIGVTATEVAAYRGVTGPTEARAAGLARALDDLRARRGGELEIVRFCEVSQARVADLLAAISAAATMPGSRRRMALKAIGRELDQVDRDLMTYLVAPVR